MNTYTATLPDGQTVKRSSAHDYKFVGAFSTDGGQTWTFAGFSGTEKNAMSAARREMAFLKSEANILYKRGRINRDQLIAELELAKLYSFVVVEAEVAA